MAGRVRKRQLSGIAIKAVRSSARLFTIKTRIEACMIIYALALGAVMRGSNYLQNYHGVGGVLLFGACLATVLIAGAKLLDGTRPETTLRRRWTD
jgi:hypothetical protein